jgi:hypothetical protein
MKRSEMAEILSKRFEEIGLNTTPSVLAESVLRMIEDAGMNPPDYTVNHFNNNENVCNIIKRQWEPEEHDMEIVG